MFPFPYRSLSKCYTPQGTYTCIMQVPTMSNNNRSSTDIRSRVTRGKLEDGEQISFFLFFFSPILSRFIQRAISRIPGFHRHLVSTLKNRPKRETRNTRSSGFSIHRRDFARATSNIAILVDLTMIDPRKLDSAIKRTPSALSIREIIFYDK